MLLCCFRVSLAGRCACTASHANSKTTLTSRWTGSLSMPSHEHGPTSQPSCPGERRGTVSVIPGSLRDLCHSKQQWCGNYSSNSSSGAGSTRGYWGSSGSRGSSRCAILMHMLSCSGTTTQKQHERWQQQHVSSSSCCAVQQAHRFMLVALSGSAATAEAATVGPGSSSSWCFKRFDIFANRNGSELDIPLGPLHLLLQHV